MSDNKTGNNHTPYDGGEPPEAAPAPRKPRKRSARMPATTPMVPVYDTVETAAAKVGLDPTALRARLRRAQRLENGSVVADLGGGITAFKFGSSWRIRFPEG